MSNDFRIIQSDRFEDYIESFVKLSGKDIHQKMVERYEDQYYEYGHDWGYGEIEQHNDKPGVLLIDVNEDGTSFVTKEFSFDQDLYEEAVEQLKTSYLELHESPVTYLELTLHDCLRKLSQADNQIEKSSYYNSFPYYRRALRRIATKLKADYKNLSGQLFKLNLNVQSNLPDPEEIAELFHKQGRSNRYKGIEVPAVMKLTRDFILKNNLSNLTGYSESIFREAKVVLGELESKNKIEKIPSRGAILNWINFYAGHAGVRENESDTKKGDDSNKRPESS